MPYTIKKLRGKYRLVSTNGKPVKNKNGKAIDGGGHDTYSEAAAQNKAIASSEKK